MRGGVEELRCNARMVLEHFAVGHGEKELVGVTPGRCIRNAAIDLGQSRLSRQVTRSRSCNRVHNAAEPEVRIGLACRCEVRRGRLQRNVLPIRDPRLELGRRLRDAGGKLECGVSLGFRRERNETREYSGDSKSGSQTHPHTSAPGWEGNALLSTVANVADGMVADRWPARPRLQLLEAASRVCTDPDIRSVRG